MLGIARIMRLTVIVEISIGQKAAGAEEWGLTVIKGCTRLNTL